MSKRARSPPLSSDKIPVRWLNLGQLHRDLRKLLYSRLTPDDKYMVKRAHGIISPPDKYIIERCIRRGHCELAKWIISTYPRMYVYGDLISTAVYAENLRMLDWLEVYDGRKRGFMADVSLAATLFQKPRVMWLLKERRYALAAAN